MAKSDEGIIYLRVPREVKDVLVDVTRGMNQARGLGESIVTVTSLVERCIAEALMPAFDRAARQIRTAVAGVARARRAPLGRTKQAPRSRGVNRTKRKALPKPKRMTRADKIVRGMDV